MSESQRSAAVRLLLINPNTSGHITDRLAASARLALAPGDVLTALTAVNGPQAVRSAEELPEATRNVIDMARQHSADHDAVLIGISLDCGLQAVRRLCAPQPVVGMTEAACRAACQHGPRFGLLTLGETMAPLYRAHVASLGLAQHLVAVAAPEMPQAFGASAGSVSEALLDRLTQAAAPLREAGAQSVVLAGAVLCGYGPALAQRLGCPVLDGMESAAQWACERVRQMRA